MNARLLTLLAVLAAPGFASAADEKPANDKINTKIANFTLIDASGKKLGLYDLKDKKAIVVVFLSFDCPVSTSYCSALAEMAKTYDGKGVAFLGVNSSDDLDPAKVAKTAAEFKITFPLLKDQKFVAADAFKATAVPEGFVLNHNSVWRSRGRIEKGSPPRLKPNPKTTSHDLKEALDDLL